MTWFRCAIIQKHGNSFTTTCQTLMLPYILIIRWNWLMCLKCTGMESLRNMKSSLAAIEVSIECYCGMEAGSWHVHLMCRSINWVGILNQGLRIAPLEVPASGYMYVGYFKISPILKYSPPGLEREFILPTWFQSPRMFVSIMWEWVFLVFSSTVTRPHQIQSHFWHCAKWRLVSCCLIYPLLCSFDFAVVHSLLGVV